jgi:PAS domain S-box-containing protein
MQKNKKILLVDDEEVIRLSFKRELRDFYDVTLASSYTEALAFLSEKQFDLLITDLVMPGLNGLELLKNVKMHSPEMYVIIITAYGEIGAVIEALRAGADDFLLKPCDVEELLLRIDKTFERQDVFKKAKICEKIFQATEDLIVQVDENGSYLTANRAYLEAYDKSDEDLLGACMADVVGRELFDTKIKPWLDRCFAGTAAQHLDLFRLTGKGVRSMVISCYPMIKEDATAVTSAAMVMKDVTDILHDNIALQQKEERLRMVHSLSANVFVDCDLTSGTIFYCDNWNKLLGYTPGTLEKMGKSPLELLHPDDRVSALNTIQDCIDGLQDDYDHEWRLQKADGSWMWFHSRGMVVDRDSQGVPLRLIGLFSDITGPKALQQNFIRDKQLFEQNVAKKTAELARHSEELTEAKAALTVLLKKRRQDKEEVEQRLSENVLNLIEPLVNRLHRTPLSDAQARILQEIEDNLHDITTSFVTKLTSRYAGLTPMEIQVATHVKQGKPTKEIADILCLAPDTINVHRKKIRKKLGLRKKSVNLRTFLSAMAEE